MHGWNQALFWFLFLCFKLGFLWFANEYFLNMKDMTTEPHLENKPTNTKRLKPWILFARQKKKHPSRISMFYINTLQVPTIVFATRERCCNCHTIWALYWDYCVCGVFYFPLAPPFPVNNNTVCTLLINMHTTNSYLQVHNLSTVLQKNSLPWDGPLTRF
jgi:hypothetical protein